MWTRGRWHRLATTVVTALFLFFFMVCTVDASTCATAEYSDASSTPRAASATPSAISYSWPTSSPAPPVTPASANRVANNLLQSAPQSFAEATQRTDCAFLQAGLVNWHDAAIWPGAALPAAGSNVTLPQGQAVLVSGCSLAAAPYGHITVPSGSSLVFADTDIELQARSLTIESGANLTIGTPTCRFRSQATLTFHGTRGDGHDKGLLIAGTADMHGELYTPSWTRLAATAMAGDSTVVLQHCINWRVGAQVVLSTTSTKDSRDYTHNEVVNIDAVECLQVDNVDGGITLGRLTFSPALNHSHYAARHEYAAEVGLLSRNIRIQGAAADSEPTDTTPVSCSNTLYDSYPCPNSFLTGHGAHLRVAGPGAIGRLAAVEFTRMGQTNVEGRYPVHFHLLGGRGNASYVEDSAIHRSFYRCVTIHGTNGLRVSRNVAFDAIGSCYYLESGSEERNVLEHNLGLHVHTIGEIMMESAASNSQNGDDVVQTADLAVPADIAAAPFYITNLANTVVGNAAVGGWTGFSMPNLPEVIGVERGLYPDLVPMNRPTLRFDGNLARSSGHFWTWVGCMCESVVPRVACTF